MPKTTVRDPPRANGWTLAQCPPSNEWGPGGNTGEIKAARKGTGHPTSKADGSGQVSSLTGTPQHTNRIWNLPLPYSFTDLREDGQLSWLLASDE